MEHRTRASPLLPAAISPRSRAVPRAVEGTRLPSPTMPGVSGERAASRDRRALSGGESAPKGGATSPAPSLVSSGSETSACPDQCTHRGSARAASKAGGGAPADSWATTVLCAVLNCAVNSLARALLLFSLLSAQRGAVLASTEYSSGVLYRFAPRNTKHCGPRHLHGVLHTLKAIAGLC